MHNDQTFITKTADQCCQDSNNYETLCSRSGSVQLGRSIEFRLFIYRRGTSHPGNCKLVLSRANASTRLGYAIITVNGIAMG